MSDTEISDGGTMRLAALAAGQMMAFWVGCVVSPAVLYFADRAWRASGTTIQ
jgi:hypothetical protein